MSCVREVDHEVTTVGNHFKIGVVASYHFFDVMVC